LPSGNREEFLGDVGAVFGLIDHNLNVVPEKFADLIFGHVGREAMSYRRPPA
jgi:hypothetical protein